ncbi:hypothetical protein HYY75_06360, partial [bacterium]|nr:hypothetical protein [bacterium]
MDKSKRKVTLSQLSPINGSFSPQNVFKKPSPFSDGFSLVELLISSGFVIFLLTLGTFWFRQMKGTASHLEKIQELNRKATLLFDQLREDISWSMTTESSPSWQIKEEDISLEKKDMQTPSEKVQILCIQRRMEGSSKKLIEPSEKKNLDLEAGYRILYERSPKRFELVRIEERDSNCKKMVFAGIAKWNLQEIF